MTETRLDVLTSDDVAEVARLHREAFPGFFLTQLGEPFLRQFYRGHVEDPTAVAVVLRDATGRPLGCVVGTTEPRGFYSRLLRRRWHGFAAAAARTVVTRPSAAPRLLRAVAYRGGADSTGQGALLSSICLSPDLQGSGQGVRLLQGWELSAHERGAKHAFLDTDALGNERVNAFYSHQGWELRGSYTTTQGRQMNRYVKELVRA
ncbi:GNAT family N-acetyltransferase [Terrabacter aerolatus]|uniref:GNAT family N-acetyltransferase n=1 Tax=Terrabacter aerolatus TaxID=422442 RepID=A0A512CZQ8_9MICO|nr:GNAT family N-acetyltransferase [Terrabacter aerolatus]